MGFFDNTAFDNLITESSRNRYNERYKRIIQQNLQHIQGKRILDLASHNGVWSWAALESGARYTFGIEGRQESINAGMSAFSQFNHQQYQFVCDDIFNGLANLAYYNQPQFDTVLCLGIFYHIMDHHRLMRMMTALKPEAIILDTGLINSVEPFIKLEFEATDQILNAIPENINQKSRLIGFPSFGAVKAMAEDCGYSVQVIQWRLDEVETVAVVPDYFTKVLNKKKRFTFRLTPNPLRDKS